MPQVEIASLAGLGGHAKKVKNTSCILPRNVLMSQPLIG
jgi:hypothetical protein